MRYIELNPVRAGMVPHPGDYAWSSYQANAQGKANELVTAHSLYRRLPTQGDERLAAYRALFKAPMDKQTVEAIRECTNKGWTLGGGRFQAKIERLTHRRATPLPKGRPKKSDAV